MEPPSLKLVMVGGPRQGETLEYKPISKVRIGRVVRGNNLCIKDDGISSKHLLIASESGRWTIQDLDSSNGTSLNSTPLSPLEPCVLSHNDTVKLGETTSILVQLVEELDQAASQSRRYPGRGARGVAKIEPVVVEDPSVEVDQAASQSRRYPRRGARGVAKIEPVVEDSTRGSEENEEVSVAEVKPVVNLESNRRGKPMKDKESDKAPIGIEPRELRSTRSRANKAGLVLENLEEGHREVRGCRKKKQNLQELPQEKNVRSVCVAEEEKPNLKENQGEEVESKKPRRGRPRRKGLQEVVLEPVKEVSIGRDDKVNTQEGLGKPETKKGQESRRKSENLQEMQLEEDPREADVGEGLVKDMGSLDIVKPGQEMEAANEEAVKGDMKVGDFENECEADVGEGAAENTGILVGEKDSKNLESEAAYEQAVKGDLTVGDSEKECGEASTGHEEGTKGRGQSGGGEANFDWEKGTFEEWFDFMEDYWPRQIIKGTEEMIEEMKRKAERVNAYIMEQRRERGVQ